jgi:hypothetical protein
MLESYVPVSSSSPPFLTGFSNTEAILFYSVKEKVFPLETSTEILGLGGISSPSVLEIRAGAEERDHSHPCRPHCHGPYNSGMITF